MMHNLSVSSALSGSLSASQASSLSGWTPHRIALITPQHQWTYAQMASWVDAIAKEVEQRGILAGDRVLLWAEPSPFLVACFFGLLRRGCVVAPISTRIPPEQIPTMAQKIRAKHLFLEDSFSDRMGAVHNEQDHRLVEGVCNTPLQWADVSIPQRHPHHSSPDVGDATALWVHRFSALPSFRQEQEGPSKETAISENTGGNDSPAFLFAFPKEALDQDATIIFTSGSAREPKAALHSYANHYYSALGSNQNIPISPNDRWLLSLPIFHVAGIGLMMRAFLAGAAVAIPSAKSSLDDAILAMQPTHLSLVPTQLLRFLEAGGAILPILQQARAILLGGSAIPSSLLERAAALDLPIFTSYGATEMASQITTTRPQDGRIAWSSSGVLLPYRALRIAEDGEIFVRGETRFRGYLTPDGLQSPFDAEGWFAMGDLGRFDDAGYLHILGRKDAMFISGGENIQPEEIEWHLAQHPLIETAMVVDIPHPLYGARPLAFVKMRDALPICEKDLNAFLSSRIARFKIPDHFLPWPSLPPHAGIKPSRNTFRQSALTQVPCLPRP